MNWLALADNALHFLFLVAIAPLVLSALCWLVYGNRERPGHTDFVGYRDPQFGDVLVERPRRAPPAWAY